jgi:HEAT repeat protein
MIAALVVAIAACSTNASRDRTANTKEPTMNRATETDAGARSIEETRERVRALIAAHSPEAPGAIAANAMDPEPLLRAFAAYQLGATHHPDAMRLLAQLSRDASPAVRGAAIEGLGTLGGDDARRLILSFALDDADVGVRAEAVSALKALGGAGAEHALERLAHDPSAPVRSAAAEALGHLRAGRPATP